MLITGIIILCIVSFAIMRLIINSRENKKTEQITQRNPLTELAEREATREEEMYSDIEVERMVLKAAFANTVEQFKKPDPEKLSVCLDACLATCTLSIEINDGIAELVAAYDILDEEADIKIPAEFEGDNYFEIRYPGINNLQSCFSDFMRILNMNEDMIVEYSYLYQENPSDFFENPETKEGFWQNMSMAEAIDNIKSLLQNPHTEEFIEIQSNGIGCQITLDASESDKPIVVATYVLYDEQQEQNIPAFLKETEDGGLYKLAYYWNGGEEKLVSQLLEIFGLNLDDNISYHLWDGKTFA